MAKPPSPPKVVWASARLRPRSDGSGKRPPTPPRSKRARSAASSSAHQPPPQVVPPRRREPPQRREPQTVFARTKIEGTSQKAEVKQLVPKGSVGRSMQPASAPKKLKVAEAYTVLKRARRASAKKVKVAIEPDEASPKYLQPPRKRSQRDEGKAKPRQE